MSRDDRSRSRRPSTAWRRNGSAAAGLADRVSVELRDYRDIVGTYDAIVSIEMLEAVGAEYYADVLRGLRPGPSAGRPAEPPGDRVSGRRVRAAAARGELDPDLHLPGRPPAVARGIERRCTGRSLLVRGVDDIAAELRPDASGLAAGVPGRLDDVRAMGFDERFIRMWDYYLSISEAGFATGLTQDPRSCSRRVAAWADRPCHRSHDGVPSRA